MIKVTYKRDKYVPARQVDSKLFKREEETITITMETTDNLEMNRIMFLAGYGMDSVKSADTKMSAFVPAEES
jgi:hypothetical protein